MVHPLLVLQAIESWLQKSVQVLSIDEFKENAGGDKYQCILVDPIHHQVLDILPSRRKKALMDYFSSFPKEERRRVKYVVIDMSHLFYSVLKEFFPQDTFIADKFHFARQVFWALENVRKSRQKTRDRKYCLYFKRSKSILRKKGSRLSPEEKEKLEIMLWQDKEPVFSNKKARALIPLLFKL
ncbi:MAG: transposase [Peptoniphilus sp. oral taxon 375]|nr:transposase [Peptoniphilus sp. oral taxon 375]